ncbi:hypothetical protein [Hydrogenothermus marinus]|uniref:Uncharacterized protein n=1 Tax=Hydrogenothermus marinus TaxID=133270 RepID=A0A3M0BK02_9AQUI|nr:hypothetical protein [Hydrogenothermus marinus]RMA97773.1 hypothetical protein CLV39_0400 [Hydrogenothermus marinus]
MDLENIPKEVLEEAKKKGFNPDDILCITCAYKSCMQEKEGRNLLGNALKKNKKEESDG